MKVSDPERHTCAECLITTRVSVSVGPAEDGRASGWGDGHEVAPEDGLATRGGARQEQGGLPATPAARGQNGQEG